MKHNAPAIIGTHVVSAPPLARTTIQSACPAPMQTGNSAHAIIIFNHFGTRAEDRNQKPDARINRAPS
jgi:hypothetical protein